MMVKKRNLWVRRIISLTILAIIAIPIISFANAKIDDGIDRINKSKEDSYLARHEKVQVVIENGDTAWNIQSKLAPGEDVRYNLFLDEQISGIDVGAIKPGEVVTFLKKK